jgi:hypothetical protein
MERLRIFGGVQFETLLPAHKTITGREAEAFSHAQALAYLKIVYRVRETHRLEICAGTTNVRDRASQRGVGRLQLWCKAARGGGGGREG